MSSNSSSDTTKMSATAAKTTKKSAKTETVEAPAPVVAAAPVAAPAKVAKASKSKAAAVEAVAAPAPVVVPPPVVAAPAAVAEAAAPEVEEDDSAKLISSISAIEDKASSLKAEVSSLLNELKTIKKLAARVAKKAGRRRKAPGAESADPSKSYFKKPLQVTDELCSFLGKDKGTQLTRADVTKEVVAYARLHNLMDKQNINADAALRKLLGITENDNLSILTLQKYLNHHYVKPAVAASK